MFTFRWNNQAIQFIDSTLPAFPEQVARRGGRAVFHVLENVTLPGFKRSGRPRWSGDMLNDLCVIQLSTNDPFKQYAWIGESGRLGIGDEDTRKHPAPFSYSLAKHDGAEYHYVSLYATDSRSRRNLRQWARQKINPNIPETKEEAEDMRSMGMDIPLWLEVDPSKSAYPFLIDTPGGGIPRPFGQMVDIVFRSLRRQMSGIWR